MSSDTTSTTGGGVPVEGQLADVPPPMPDSATLPRQPFRVNLEVKNFSAPPPPGTGGGKSREINNSGMFYVDSNFMVQQKRMEDMKNAQPEKAQKLFQTYTQMVVMSAAGDINGILGLMASTGSGAPPAWFAVKMFQTGVLGMNLEVPRFMVKNGFDCRMGPLETILFDLVVANGKDSAAGEGKISKKERLMRDRKFVEAMVFLAVECELNVMSMRKGDYMSLMHLAAKDDLPQMVLCLIELGCDINAVAGDADDSTPLMMAEKGKGGKDGKTAVILRKRGAKSEWREGKRGNGAGGGAGGWGSVGLTKDDNIFKGKFKTMTIGSEEAFSKVEKEVKGGGVGGGKKVEEEVEEEEGEEENYNKYTFECS
ncbi:hypothetical protein TrVE_jg1417 [Triparma verrucosa]|uniref:Uncharacterized protein n=1 Tax=Triparma verrucosa TaxID=1606542 RepID=A0A9W7F8I0_9STRA|nr:hypothetical protein TrVE_jg1417 [Triparma verrucosa]